MTSMLPLPFARGSQRSLERMFDDCARDQGCAAAYPRLREGFAAVLERLEKAPARVRLRPEGRGAEETIEFSRELLATTTRSILYNTQRISRLPNMIHDAYRGNYTEYAQMAVSIRRFHLDNNGMYLAVVCADDVDFIDPVRVAAETAGTFIGDYWYRQVAAACAVVPHGKAPSDFHTTVRIDAPALLLSGYLDPSTPPEMGNEVAAGLPNGVHVVMRNRSHGTEGPDDYACVDRVIAQFVERGTTRELDTSCLMKLRPRPFVLPQ
jgi:pimeloyl-ACP methyl ester carboxylesterase